MKNQNLVVSRLDLVATTKEQENGMEDFLKMNMFGQMRQEKIKLRRDAVFFLNGVDGFAENCFGIFCIFECPKKLNAP